MAITTEYIIYIDTYAGVLIKNSFSVVQYIWYFHKIANCKDKKCDMVNLYTFD